MLFFDDKFALFLCFLLKNEVLFQRFGRAIVCEYLIEIIYVALTVCRAEDLIFKMNVKMFHLSVGFKDGGILASSDLQGVHIVVQWRKFY